MFENIIEQSLVFLPLVLGVFLSFSILRIPDLTVDGSFVLGAGVFAKSLHLGIPVALAILLAILAGAVAGLFTASIQRKNRIPPLIAGILALFILQSVNLVAMGKPNLNLLYYPSFLEGWSTSLTPYGTLILLSMFGLTMAIALRYLFKTSVGLNMRAFGCNASLLRLFGKEPERYRTLGLMLANAMVAFSGVLTAQHNGFADVNMGVGLVLIGIGIVIIGQQLLAFVMAGKRSSIGAQIFACFVATLIYFASVQGLVAFGIKPLFLKMAIGLLLVATLLLSRDKSLRSLSS